MIGNTHRLRVERNPWEDERSISRVRMGVRSVDTGCVSRQKLLRSDSIGRIKIVIREKMIIDGEERKQEETINDQFQADKKTNVS